MQGTVTTGFAIAADAVPAAQQALLDAGFEVSRDQALEEVNPQYGAVVEASAFYGVPSPDGETQNDHAERAAKALSDAGIDAQRVGGAVTVSAEAHPSIAGLRSSRPTCNQLA